MVAISIPPPRSTFSVREWNSRVQSTRVTNDIVKGLSLPYTEASRAKEMWGSARSSFVDPHEVFEVPGGAQVVDVVYILTCFYIFNLPVALRAGERNATGKIFCKAPRE